MKEIEILKKIIDASKKIVFFTGAGISVPSGIPDFRSSEGLYKSDLRAEEILSHDYFMNHPEDFYDFYKTKMIYPDAKPNIAHKWMAELEKEGRSLGVITQNIDGLHTLAESQKVVELHGSIYRNHCLKCHKSYGLKEVMNSHHCECGGIIKPDVVLYGEPLNNKDINEAIEMIIKADTLIIVGTSLNVYPAASFIEYYSGDNLILINKGATYKHVYAKLVIDDDIVEVVKKLQEL